NDKNINKNDDIVRFGLMSRMLQSKGVSDFVEASKIVNEKNNIEFNTFLNLKKSLIQIEEIDYLKKSVRLSL
ncbi:MAG TPA: hypothetical protein DHW07_03980, partial [Gammaproteobacteria bacterium]|nr:hypothetical protein [Gammaproteobacteria bacterium]